MNGSSHIPPLVYLPLIALFLWRIYMRLRRSVGRQPLRLRRSWLSVILFPLLTALMLLATLGRPLPILALLGGAAIGVALGIYGVRLTRFEPTPAGLYYTPNAHIGVALTLLLIGRLAYRLVVTGGLMAGAVATGGAPGTFHPIPPLTLLFFGPLAGYYTTYSIALLRWRYSLKPSALAVQPADPQG